MPNFWHQFWIPPGKNASQIKSGSMKQWTLFTVSTFLHAHAVSLYVLSNAGSLKQCSEVNDHRMHGRSTAFRACKSSYFDFLIFGVSAFCLLTKPLFSLHFLEAKEENLIHSNQICTPRPVFVSQLTDVSDNHSTNLMSRADYGIVNRSLYVLKKSCFRYSTL